MISVESRRRFGKSKLWLGQRKSPISHSNDLSTNPCWFLEARDLIPVGTVHTVMTEARGVALTIDGMERARQGGEAATSYWGASGCRDTNIRGVIHIRRLHREGVHMGSHVLVSRWSCSCGILL